MGALDDDLPLRGLLRPRPLKVSVLSLDDDVDPRETSDSRPSM
jgi:hypothetical protein